MQVGITLERWSIVTTSMIEKDPGRPHINRLRVIHLYEADYNLMLKILWARRLTWNAHSKHALHPAQAGSCPGRRAIDTVTYKEQKYLYARLTRTPIATMDNDAKSCYDRILCNLAMLVSQYHGMPKNACAMQAATLKHTKFHLRSALGISKQHYQHTRNEPIYGSGQGSSSSPALWLLISSTLMKCFDQLTPGMTMYPIQNKAEQLHSNIDGFVDDTSLFVNLTKNQTRPQQLLESLESITQGWSDLLYASGGKLELPKCFYYAIKWKFSNDGDPIPITLTNLNTKDSSVHILDPDSITPIAIAEREPNQAHKTLGVFKTLTGCEKVHLEYIKAKSDNLASLVKGSHMTREQAWTSYNMIYKPTIQYSLSACSFNADQIGSVHKRHSWRSSHAWE